MDIVSRSEWGARPPKARHTMVLPSPRLWVHHTATEQHGAAGVRAIQAFHMDANGWLDIAYSFLVDDDGTIFEGRGAGVVGGHTEGDNSRSHAICLMGDFEGRAPAPAAIDSLVWLARHGARLDWWYPTLGGHRDAPGASTACPGRHLYADLPTVRARVAGQPPEDDMTPEQAQMLADIHKHVVGDGRLRDVYVDVAGDGRLKEVTLAARALLAASGDDVDGAAVAAALLPGLVAALVPALAAELPQVDGSVVEAAAESAVRRVLADAATPDAG